MVLEPLQPSDLPTLEAWFEDEELSRRLGGMLPLSPYIEYVQREPDYFAWMARDGDEPVGAAFLQVTPGEPAAFTFLVNPLLRSRGYGRHILKALLARPEGAAVQRWQADVETDNVASRRCLASVGFVLESDVPDADGLLYYAYAPARPGADI